MLSAVENHYGGGPGRPYPHHFGGGGGGGQQGASLQMPRTSAAMTAAEFARPHPKPRYSGGSLRNGLTSPRSKYSEQTGPVNLAVSQSAAAITLSLADENVGSSSASLSSLSRRQSPGAIGATAENGGGSVADHSSGQTQPPSHSSSINGLFCPAKLSFCPTTGGPTNGYQAALNYSTLYGRTNAIYGTPSLYNSHLVGRSLHRSNYQLDPYSTYLPPVTYSPPGVVPPQQLPQPPPVVMAQPAPISAVQTSPDDVGNSVSNDGCPSLPPPSPSISVAATAKLVNDRSHPPQAPQQQQQQQQQQQSLHHTQQQPLVLNSNNSNSSSSTYCSSSKTKEKLEGTVQSGQQHHLNHHHQSPHHNSNNNNSSHNQNLITSNGKTVGFKVPSGKEGSLKHRILTRPYGEKESKPRSSSAIHGSVVRSSNNNNAPTNFTKGSLIELYNGELRRVEDMRTEDFISSSSKNPDLQLAETTVVKITPRPSNVMITFSYNNLKYDMESVTEHPYFVYGQGWASCDPEGSARVFGLKCQRLQVGDVCISLTPRDSVLAQQPQHGRSASISGCNSGSHHQSSAQPPLSSHHLHQQHPPPPHQSLHPQQQPPQTHHQPPSPQQAYYNNCVYNYCKDQVDQAQNLSRKPLPTVPTTATATAVTSRPAPHFIEAMAGTSVSHPLHMHQPTSSTAATSYSAYLNGGSNGRTGGFDDRRPHSNHSSSSAALLLLRSTSCTTDDSAKHINDPTNMSINMSKNTVQHLGSGVGASNGGRPLSNHAPYADTDESVDVSSLSSRKRRWSAPDNICEDEACQQSGKKCKH